MFDPRKRYQIKSVKRVEPPPGAEGSAWCQYVIKQGRNTIRGYRQGSLRTVRGAVNQIVKQLNERREGKRHMAAPRRTKTAKN